MQPPAGPPPGMIIPVTPAAPPPAPPGRFYSPNAVGVASFIGSPLAGGIVLALNYRLLRRPGAAWGAAALGAAITAALLVLGSQLPQLSTTGGIAMAVAFGMVGLARAMQGRSFDAHIGAGGREGSSWAALGIGLPFLAVIIAGLVWSGRGPNVGQREAVGSHGEIYFKGGATRAEAKRLGAFLTQEQYFAGPDDRTVLLRHEGETTIVSLVFKTEAAADPTIRTLVARLAAQISDQLYLGGPVTVHLVDGELNRLAEIPMMPVLARMKDLGSDQYLFYARDVSEQEVDKVGEQLRELGFFDGSGAKTVLVSNTVKGRAVSFVVGAEAAKDEQIRTEFRTVGSTLSSTAFGGAPTAVILIDGELQTLATLEP